MTSPATMMESLQQVDKSAVLALVSTFSLYLLYASCFLFLLLLLVYIWIRPQQVDESVPGPKRVPYLGVTFGTESEMFDKGEFTWSDWPTLGLTLSRQYRFQTWGGPSLNIGFGGAFFNIVSPECLQHVLRDNFDNYEKGKVARKCLQELLGTGIFTADGSVWKKHRKLITSIMSKDTVYYSSELLQSKLHQVEGLLDDASSKDETIDFQDVCYRMVLDVFVKMAFGVELNTVLEARDDKEEAHDSFMVAFNDLQYLCHQRFNDLLWEVKQYFCWGERERLIRQKARVIDRFANDIVVRACMEQQLGTPNSRRKNQRPDLIRQCLVQAERLEEPVPSHKDLRDLVMNFVLAGRDSTAVGLSWTLYELTKHPSVADKIRDEVQSICGEQDDLSIGYAEVENLEYTHAVVMEALRLHPPVPDDFKFAKKADVLPDGTKVPAGACVMYSPNSINRSDKNWGETVDEFIPERFLKKTEPSAFRYPTFNAGPRLCPGKPLALMEIKTALAFLLPRFDFVDEQGHKGDYRWTLVMAMKEGFPVKVKRRNS